MGVSSLRVGCPHASLLGLRCEDLRPAAQDQTAKSEWPWCSCGGIAGCQWKSSEAKIVEPPSRECDWVMSKNMHCRAQGTPSTQLCICVCMYNMYICIYIYIHISITLHIYIYIYTYYAKYGHRYSSRYRYRCRHRYTRSYRYR